jgi:glutathione synthase/RimK-type ligase-like ATP-grasp enzyme
MKKSMPQIAFATCQQFPDISDDDSLLAKELRSRGVAVQAAVWDSPDVNWFSFDQVLIRSTWDYHLKPRLYEQWLRGFLAAPGRLWNPPAAVLANINKRYLLDLAEHGVDVIPTKYVAAGERHRLQKIIESLGWDEVVIKPAISAMARGTWRTSLAQADAHQERFAEQAEAEDMLVQPYFAEIASQGEWSLIFLGGQYSHAVLKKPADEDFRVQRHAGGRAVPAVAGSELVDRASAIFAHIQAPLLYARVDAIERDHRLLLMELEINEPCLFLSMGDRAATRLAESMSLPELSL